MSQVFSQAAGFVNIFLNNFTADDAVVMFNLLAEIIGNRVSSENYQAFVGRAFEPELPNGFVNVVRLYQNINFVSDFKGIVHFRNFAIAVPKHVNKSDIQIGGAARQVHQGNPDQRATGVEFQGKYIGFAAENRQNSRTAGKFENPEHGFGNGNK